MTQIISWNVNGIRAAQKKGLLGFVTEQTPDILCLQEVKARQEQVDLSGFEDYEVFWNAAVKPGYSGTAVFTKSKPLNVNYGLDIPAHDQEGRVITAEYQAFYLVNVYTPNAQRELKRLNYRSQSWDRDFLSYVSNLKKRKPVIICGDLNVAHKEIDIARPKANLKTAGFTIEERQGFDRLLAAGFVDSFRHFYPDKAEQYTWWSYRAGARAKNIGWRIDYFCVSEELMNQVKAAEILPEVMGSDHCPVKLTLK